MKKKAGKTIKFNTEFYNEKKAGKTIKFNTEFYNGKKGWGKTIKFNTEGYVGNNLSFVFKNLFLRIKIKKTVLLCFQN